MKSNPLSKLHAILVEVEVDSNEMIAQEMLAEGLSGNPEEDTWMLNARLENHHFDAYSRQRHYPLGLAG
jgi:hypothetical protein